VRHTTDPGCSSGCSYFYLEPDTSYGLIYLQGYDFYPYVGEHVEVIGTAAACGECSVLDVVTLLVLAPLGVTEGELPLGLSLGQNYPNPFNPETRIVFSIPRSQYVRLTVHNILGQVVGKLVDRAEQAGLHSVSWNAGSSAGGLYYYRLQTADGTLVRRMLLLR
jgi:hypothetical protein